MIGVGSVGVFFDADMSGFNAGIGRAESRLLTFQRSANRIGGNLQKFGRRASLLSLPVQAAVGASIFQFGKFDQKMVESTSIMGDMSDSIRKEMRDTALTMSQSTIFSADKLAESYYFLASAGMNAEQSIAALGPVAQFATAGAFDLARATDLLTDAQSALGLSSKDAQENMSGLISVSDVLVKAGTLANATVQQFSEALTNKAGAAIRTLNKDMEEGIAVLAAFADQGIKGTGAGEQLGMILTYLEDASQNSREAFEKYGFSVYDQSGTFRNMADIIENLETALAGKNDETRSAILSELGFASRTQKTLKVLLGTSGAVRAYEAALRDAGGITDDVANKQAKSFNAQMTRLGNTLKVTSILLGEQLAPGIGAVANQLQKAAAWFNQLNPIFKKTVAYTMLFVSVLGPGAFMLGTIIKLLPVFALGMLAIKKATIGFALPFIAAHAPIIAVVGAIALVGMALTFARGEGNTFFERLESGWAKNKEDATGFFEYIKDRGGKAFQYLQYTALSTLFNLEAFWKKGKAHVAAFADSFTGGVNWIEENWQIAFWGMLETIGVWARNVATVVSNVFGNMRDNLFSLFDSIWNKIKNPGSAFQVDFTGLLDGWDEGLLKAPTLRPGGVFQSESGDNLKQTLKDIDKELGSNLLYAYEGIYNKAKASADVIEKAAEKVNEETAAAAENVAGKSGTGAAVQSQSAMAAGSAEAVRSMAGVLNSLNRTQERDAQRTRERQLEQNTQTVAELGRIRNALSTEDQILNINY